MLGPGSSLYDGGDPVLGPGSSLYGGDGIQCWGQDPPCMMGRGSSAGARVLPV